MPMKKEKPKVVGRVLLVESIGSDGYESWKAEFRVVGEDKRKRIYLEDETEGIGEAVDEGAYRLGVAKSRFDILVIREVRAVDTAGYREFRDWLRRGKRQGRLSRGPEWRMGSGTVNS